MSPLTLRRAFLQFAASVVVVVLLVGAVGFWLLHRAATSEALDDAKNETRIVGSAIVAPLLGGDARQLRTRLDALFARGGLGDRVSHVKVWTPDGRVLYSTEPQLIGRRFAFSPEDRRALATLGSEADVSDLSAPENRFERVEGKLLEVYAGIRAPSGRHVLFETYRPYTIITADERRLRDQFAPVLLAAVLLLALLMLPLVLGMGRRIERARREREGLLRRALDASLRERTRVARDLHDGPVQRLSGVAFSLAGAERSPADSHALRATIRASAEQVRETVRELRSTLTDLYPPNLERQGLRTALGDTLAPLRAAGIVTELDVAPELSLDAEAEAALFRAAQEASRNALEHAQPHAVRVAVHPAGDRVVLEVSDDGAGFVTGAPREGHFGLQLLDDLARDVGGRLEVESVPGAGTRVRFEVPA